MTSTLARFVEDMKKNNMKYKEKNSGPVKLPKPEYYLNRCNGDLYIINWDINRPNVNELVWIEISELAWNNLSRNFKK